MTGSSRRMIDQNERRIRLGFQYLYAFTVNVRKKNVQNESYRKLTKQNDNFGREYRKIFKPLINYV